MGWAGTHYYKSEFNAHQPEALFHSPYGTGALLLLLGRGQGLGVGVGVFFGDGEAHQARLH